MRKSGNQYISPGCMDYVPMNDMRLVRRIKAVLGERNNKVSTMLPISTNRYVEELMWKNKVYSAQLIIALAVKYVETKGLDIEDMLSELEGKAI